MKFFRKNALVLDLGSFGQKKQVLGSAAYLAEEGSIRNGYLRGRVEVDGPVTIDWEKQTKTVIEAQGKVKYYTLNGQGTAQFELEKAKTAHLVLLKLSLTENRLKNILNKDASIARKSLASERGDGRVVSAIWVVAEAELGERFRTAASVGGSVTADLVDGKLQITASHTSQGSSTVVYAEGSTFAYAMHKVSAWNKGRTQIEDLEDDYAGLS